MADGVFLVLGNLSERAFKTKLLGHEHGVVTKALAAAQLVPMRPSTVPSTVVSSPASLMNASAHTKRPVRCSSGTPSSSASTLRCSRHRRHACPHSAPSTRPACHRGIDHEPESSASAAMPVASWAARALMSALPTNVSASSSGSGYDSTCDRVRNSQPGKSSAVSISSTLCLLLVAMTTSFLFYSIPRTKTRAPQIPHAAAFLLFDAKHIFLSGQQHLDALFSHIQELVQTVAREAHLLAGA